MQYAFLLYNHDAFHVWLFSYTFYVILLRETYKVKQLQVLIYKDFNMSHHCGSGRNSYKWGAPLLWWMWLSTSKSHKLCIISYFISCLTSLLHFSAALSDVCNHCSFFFLYFASNLLHFFLPLSSSFLHDFFIVFLSFFCCSNF